MRCSVALAVLACGLPVFGWGPVGHSLVARIAWEQLKPAARARVTAILPADQTLASIASWADEVRPSRAETAPWHYIDIPVDKPHREMARDCRDGNCVTAKIADFRNTVKNAAALPDDRREALMFLVHFVGDMHQPLHCSDHADRGGNSIRVQFFDRPSNLHSVWDSGFLSRLGNEQELFPELLRESVRHASKWTNGSVEDWAEQTHKLAQKIVYGKLPKVPDGALVPLGARYERLAEPLLKMQIEKAGARLAFLLNTDLRD
jgi:hypothetical protein